MAEQTNITWCDHTWSPWYGCTQVSLGAQGACVGCFARQISEIRMHRVVFGGPGRGEGTRDVRADSAWKEPLRWERRAAASKRAWHAPGGPPEGGLGRPWPYSPFVFPSMCDPFDNHPDLREPRRRFFDLIRSTPHLTWLLLTKRPSLIRRLFVETLSDAERDAAVNDRSRTWASYWPRNAAIGCTVVTQEEANRDVPRLLAAKEALKPAFAFLSMEPLLGAVDLTRIDTMRFAGAEVLNGLTGVLTGMFGDPCPTLLPQVDWVITGGETDQGAHKARPSHPDWFRSLRDQCAAAGVAFHHKQNGEWLHRPEMISASGPSSHQFADGAWMDKVGKKAAGRLLDGATLDARPVVP